MAPLSTTAQALLERLSFLGHAPVPDGLLDIHTHDAPAEDLRGAMAELTARGFVSPGAGGHFPRPDNFAPLGREASRTSRQHMIAALRWLDQAFDRDPRDPAHWPWLEPLMRHALFVSARAGAAGVMVPTIRLMNELALLHDVKGLLADAEMIYRRVLTLNEAHAGPDDPAVAVSLSNLGGLLYRTGDLAEVEALFRRALAIEEQAHGPEHAGVAHCLNNLADLLRGTSRLEDARGLLHRAMVILTRQRHRTGQPSHAFPVIGASIGGIMEWFHGSREQAVARLTSSREPHI